MSPVRTANRRSDTAGRTPPVTCSAAKSTNAASDRAGERTAVSALRDSPTRIRSIGCATETGESAAGVSCVAAPVPLFDTVVAGLSACGPCDRIRVDELEFRVKWIAAEI
ncbi:IclR family transcriptional regulator C-terminal domain-containing protein [Streptomyces sp. NPDC058001]|uniref:IclR family transcriptional regulator domain-containing protein n=1 Tax=Streptomyces sp. NPDC058001 TaxID=3346300 RepID=UPI0036E0AF0C